MKNSVLYIIFIFFLLNSVVVDAQKNRYNQLQIPSVNRNEEVICHTSYCFVYDEDHEQAKWVAYKLTKQMAAGDEPRDDDFKTDPAVTSETATNNDYKGSGFDRGHLAPAADMSLTKTSMEESFYFSNICPQDPGFNRGIWKKLETLIREFAVKLGSIYVVTGPILKTGLPSFGDNEVSVPEYFYKAVLFVSDSLVTSIAFVMPNEKQSSKSVFKYAVSVDYLEKETGIDLFPKLPYFIEKKTEKQCDTIQWKQFLN